jgi:hypothetical protein
MIFQQAILTGSVSVSVNVRLSLIEDIAGDAVEVAASLAFVMNNTIRLP